MTPRGRFDVLGLGYTAVDDLLYVATYPPPDAKAQVLRRERQCGGLTATALVAAARLGATCAYAGVLGRDELSAFVTDCLVREGIDLEHVVDHPTARPIHSTVVVDIRHQTRAIFYDLQGVIGVDTERPAEEVIRAARVLFVDPCGIPGMTRAARIARDHAIPVVADIEGDVSPPLADLLALVDHLIVSREIAMTITGEQDPARAVRALWKDDRAAVIVTCGRDGGWYLAADGPGAPQHYPAYTVETVDTTGCGDVFHGAYSAALARGVDMPERVCLAAAAAALKATQPGGQAGIPSWASVEMFMKEREG